MNIKNVPSVGDAHAGARPTPPAVAAVSSAPAVHVSAVDASRMADMARTEQIRAGTLRTVRLAHIEDAIRSGTYQPSASQVASRMLDAAEIDAHMKDILGR